MTKKHTAQVGVTVNGLVYEGNRPGTKAVLEDLVNHVYMFINEFQTDELNDEERTLYDDMLKAFSDAHDFLEGK